MTPVIPASAGSSVAPPDGRSSLSSSSVKLFDRGIDAEEERGVVLAPPRLDLGLLGLGLGPGVLVDARFEGGREGDVIPSSPFILPRLI